MTEGTSSPRHCRSCKSIDQRYELCGATCNKACLLLAGKGGANLCYNMGLLGLAQDTPQL